MRTRTLALFGGAMLVLAGCGGPGSGWNPGLVRKRFVGTDETLVPDGGYPTAQTDGACRWRVSSAPNGTRFTKGGCWSCRVLPDQGLVGRGAGDRGADAQGRIRPMKTASCACALSAIRRSPTPLPPRTRATPASDMITVA